MFHEQRMSVPDSPDGLRAEYDADLQAALERDDPSAAGDAIDVDRTDIEALSAGESPDLSLEEAAEIQSLAEGTADPETIVTMACEHLLLGMSTAVLDVDAVESELDLELDAKEIQQKIERRAPMSFDEFVHIQYVIVDSVP
ncbi:hypothetical protein EA462_11200 [Natrarchaeobius halalkaliphilus]|uniref:Uncharacterized protein n=1 Tax=Natrarchaeobius halalkaliphilus TaxID=1679091 RepID=A0A3N6M1I4_9EURY|nr:DUF5791 family protein [Natrarchaeobius halalkaliphilus]RQG88951.1 hypothetical protein EA462_11200 [Natrarchaeobius halalkaliphilus]